MSFFKNGLQTVHSNYNSTTQIQTSFPKILTVIKYTTRTITHQILEALGQFIPPPKHISHQLATFYITQHWRMLKIIPVSRVSRR